MNIIVAVKYVPDATADRRFEDDGTVDRVGVDGLLSELDEYAVEQALQLKEKSDGEVTVTALTVGRDASNDLVIEHRLASRRHARFEKDEVGFYIHDLESTNGTFVNGQRVQGRHLLRNNDEVWVGDTVLVFRDPEATMKGTPPPVASS